MKKLLFTVLSIVLILGAAYLVHLKFFSLKSTADKLMRGFTSGEFYVAEFGGGSSLFLPIDQVTYALIEDVALKNGKKWVYEEVFERREMWFNIPRGIKNYKYEEINSFEEVTLLRSVNISKESYEEEIPSQDYDSYQKTYINIYKNNPGYIFDTINEQIIYETKYPDKRIIYTIETFAGKYRTQMMFLKQNDGWKLAAIFSTEI